MNIADLLSPQRVAPLLRASGKSQVLSELAKRLSAEVGLAEADIFAALKDRENLGSTGVGSGIAMPHARLKGITRMVGYFARLDRAIDFQSIDGQPVDLVFLLLTPPDGSADHLKALARVSRLLRDGDTCRRLRAGDAAEGLYAILTACDGAGP